ncbi:MAG: AraC family transcriptional regulator [Alphaproteobacteria bacterium]|nr:MAG: AraC family transcriptional regulator [Alphaproteobacteria bacterium]
MNPFRIVDAEPTPYLFVERSAAPDEIGSVIGPAFGEVWAFMEHHGIAPAGGAIAVYTSYGPEKMDFRAGFVISREDMAAAQGAVKADVTPAGRAVHGLHRGSYGNIRETYGKMHAFVTAEGLEWIAPTWEIYLNSPDQVPEEQLLTELYQAVRG